ncbi:MAG: hypothetical protein JXR68_02260 [Bacteroidales bacterium]|nr:hypothetical protein [Bacteroidales bacterium]
MPFHENIQIDKIIISQSENYSEYFIQKTFDIYYFSEKNQENTKLFNEYIDICIDEALIDENFNEEEKALFINTLYVYDSTLYFCYNFYNNLKTGEDDYWKVPVRDWVGGIIDCISGQAGVISGYLGGSALSAISLLKYKNLKRYQIFLKSTKICKVLQYCNGCRSYDFFFFKIS